MKRDMDLLRAIMLFAEEQVPAARFKSCEPPDFQSKFPALDRDTLCEHIRLLEETQYLKKVAWSYDGAALSGLTMVGFDYLDTIRDDEIWRKAKDGAREAGGFTLDLLGDLAKGLIKTQIKRTTGVEL
jgi:hypothetical protein